MNRKIIKGKEGQVPLAGIILITVSTLLITLSVTIVKNLADVGVFKVSMARFAVPMVNSVPVLLAIYFRSGSEPFTDTMKRWAPLFARCFPGGLQLGTSYYAFKNMPLGGNSTWLVLLIMQLSNYLLKGAC